MDKLPENIDRTRVTATGVDVDNFHVQCGAGHPFAVSLWQRDGDVIKCDYPNCFQQHLFYAGLYAAHRKTVG